MSILDKVLDDSEEPEKPKVISKRDLEEPPHDGKWYLKVYTKNPGITYKFYTNNYGKWTKCPEKGTAGLTWGFLKTYAYNIEVYPVD